MGRRQILAAAAALLAALTGCISSCGDQASGTPSRPSPPRATTVHQIYLSIGDSYAAGMQPTSATERHPTRNGFAYQLVDLAEHKGYAFSLANFACGGATTGSVLHRTGCDHDRLGPGASPYDRTTQATAAARFLRAHRGHVGLITVSLGLNDLIPCATAADATSCVMQTRARIKHNLGRLLDRLHSAAGPGVRIVGSTYPDVFLAGLLNHPTWTRKFAKRSVWAFRSQINPQLSQSYESVGGRFVDVTKATGGYGSLDRTTTLPPYGTIPVPVAKICHFTYECRFHDVHPRTRGYALIARLIAHTLPGR
jgi:lysophospholipase L1-like esterase